MCWRYDLKNTELHRANEFISLIILIIWCCCCFSFSLLIPFHFIIIAPLSVSRLCIFFYANSVPPPPLLLHLLSAWVFVLAFNETHIRPFSQYFKSTNNGNKRLVYIYRMCTHCVYYTGDFINSMIVLLLFNNLNLLLFLFARTHLWSVIW